MPLADIQVLCFAGIITGASILIILERVRPYSPQQKFFREGFFDDFIWYNFVQSFILGFVISFLIDWIDHHTHWSRLQLVTHWPLGLQWLFFFVTHDFYIYWFHRLQHSNRYLWRLHEAHHSTKDVDWLSGARSHSLEILINQTIEFAPIVLLGAAPEIAVIKGLIDAVWGMYIHSNIDVHSGKLQWIINGPEMHRWHHSDGNEKAHNKNFSTKLAVWDWIFRTAFLPDSEKPLRYGLSDPSFPKKYFPQQIFAFRKLKRPVFHQANSDR
ncbi:sterol desaturase family protein [bacterium]|nr:sterol desaturase family protein [bacterium]